VVLASLRTADWTLGLLLEERLCGHLDTCAKRRRIPSLCGHRQQTGREGCWIAEGFARSLLWRRRVFAVVYILYQIRPPVPTSWQLVLFQKQTTENGQHWW